MDSFDTWDFLELEETIDESDDEEVKLLRLLLLLRRRQRRKQREIWISAFRAQRKSFSVFHTLLQTLTDLEFKQYLRVTMEQFSYIHEIIEVDIKRKHTTFREPISTQQRLALCLR